MRQNREGRLMKKITNALGEPCPVPVMKAKKGLRELKNGDTLTVLVDNETSAENLLKMAVRLSIRAELRRTDDSFQVEFFYEGQKLSDKMMGKQEACEDYESKDMPKNTSAIVVAGSDRMGEGSDELGKALMKSFFYALAGMDEAPDTVLFYNGGVRLACEGSQVLPDLEQLEEQGTEILSCGACLDYYQLKSMLRAGKVTNMYEIVKIQNQAGRIIRP